MSSPKPWMVRQAGEQKGPFTTEELQAEIGAGRVKRADFVRFGEGAFRRVSEFSALAVSSAPPRSSGANRTMVLIAAAVLAVVVIGTGIYFLLGRPSEAPRLPDATVALVNEWPFTGAAAGAPAMRAGELDYVGCAHAAQRDFTASPSTLTLQTFSDCVALANLPADKGRRDALLNQIAAYVSANPSAAPLLVSQALLAHGLGRDEDAHLAESAALSELPNDPRVKLLVARRAKDDSALIALSDHVAEAMALLVDRRLEQGRVHGAWDVLAHALDQPAVAGAAVRAVAHFARRTFLGDEIRRELMARPQIPAVLMADIGFFAAQAETAESMRPFFEPRMADASQKPAVSLALAALLTEEARDPEARTLLEGLKVDESRQDALAAVMALRAGDAAKASMLSDDLIESRYFAALAHGLGGDLKQLTAVHSQIPGPLVGLALAALSKERDPTLRLQPLLDAEDGLAELNPGALPLFDGGLRAIRAKLTTDADAGLRGLCDVWLGQSPAPVAGAPWVAAALAYQKKQYSRAAQILEPLVRGDEAETAVMGLYGRVLEHVEIDWAEDHYREMEADDATGADLGRLRILLARKDNTRALELARTLYKDGAHVPEVMRELFRAGDK